MQAALRLGRGAAGAVSLAWRAGRWLVVGYVAATLLVGLLPVAAALLTRSLVDLLGAPSRDSTTLIAVVVATAVAGIAVSVIPLWTNFAIQELQRRVSLAAHGELFRAVNRLRGIGHFETPAFLDRLQLARQAVDFAPGQIVQSAFGGARSALTAIGFVVSLAALNGMLAALVLAAAVPALLAQLALNRHRAAMLAAITPTQRRQGFFAGLLTTAQAAKEIRLNGTGEHLRALMHAQQRSALAGQAAIDRAQLRTQGALALVSGLISGGALLWAVLATRGTTLTVGDVVLLVAAVAGTQASLASMVDAIGGAHEALLLFEHYTAVLRTPPDLPVPPNPRPVNRLATTIEIRDVWFRYDEDHPWVLRGVNVTIQAGQACALVGVNGSGKSTLVKLLCRLYEPQRGSIYWDGVDIRALDLDELRRRIGVLFQDFMQYDLTAAHNIALGDLGALQDRHRVVEAAQLAGIHAAIAALPRGYDTNLSRTFVNEADQGGVETGVVLSGGQWQRIALARALLGREHDLLIMDEPSSGLDAEAEYEIHTTLRAHREGRTSLLISHRLSTIRDADQIVVLAAGTVVEQGTHDRLMATGGVYARLFDIQARGYRGEQAGERDSDAGTAGRRVSDRGGDLVDAP